MEIGLNCAAVLFLALIWVGLVESKLEIRISKYQIGNLKSKVPSLSLDHNLFHRNKDVTSVIVERIMDINKRYGVLLDFILSFENWIKRFSGEYHGNTFKNKDVLASIISINSEFEVLKLKFNEISDEIDVFIDTIISKEPSKCLNNERQAKAKYKKEIEGFYRRLLALNLDIKRLVRYQHKLITSSSLYIVRLDSGTNQLNKVQKHEIVDMSNENGLYDLWVYYEHHRLPNLKEKIAFISRSISLFIRQNRIILEFLSSRYKVLTKQHSEILKGPKNDYSLMRNSSEVVRSDNLRAGGGGRSPNPLVKTVASGTSSAKQKQLFFRKCLDADELGLIIPLDSVWKVDGLLLDAEFGNVVNMVKFLMEELESRCSEFQKDYAALSEFKAFISENLQVNTTNINDFFFSGKPNIKKSVLSQLTYQVSQLNTISEFTHTLEERLKTYHCFNIPCYYGIINYYLKHSFNKLLGIFSLEDDHPGQNQDLGAIRGSEPDGMENAQNSSLPLKTKWQSVSITSEMTDFMFNSSEIARSARNSDEFNKFPSFGTKYNFTIFSNITCFAPNVNIGGFSEQLEVLLDRFSKNIIVHEKVDGDE